MSEIYSETYRGIKIYWNTYIKLAGAPDYGAYTFTWKSKRYDYPNVQNARDAIDLFQGEKEEQDSGDKQKKYDDLGQEIEDNVEIVDTGASALPWYVAWLEPVLILITEKTADVMDWMTPILAPISSASDYLRDIPQNLVDGFVDAVSSIYNNARNEGASTATQTMSDINEGSPPWMQDLEAQLTAMFTPMIEQYLEKVDVTNYESSTPSPTQAVTALNNWRAGVMGLGLANFFAHVLAEAGTLGQLEAVKDFEPLVISKLGLDALANKATLLPFEKGIIAQAEKFYNQKYQTEIPQVQELINMVVKDKMTVEEFKQWMQLKGFSDDWSQLIWDAHFIQPNYEAIRSGLYRGLISPEDWDAAKIRADLDPEYNNIWDGLLEQIPPYPDLVRLRTREKLTEEEFRDYLQDHGYDPKWATLLYEGAKVPPSLGDIITTWRRGLIREEDLPDLMRVVDLDYDTYPEIFNSRKYDDPSVTMSRFMFETGAIDENRVLEIVKRAGYTDSDSMFIMDFITRFQERLWRRRYIVQLQRGYERGVIPEEELRQAIREAHYTDGVAHWIIETSNLRNRIRGEPTEETAKALTLGDLKTAYTENIISEDVFITEMGLKGYTQSDINILVELLNKKKTATEAGGKKVSLTQSEMMNAWRYEELTEDALRIDLGLRGLTQDEINMLISTKKKQWGMIE